MENGDVMEHGKSCCFSGHRPSKLPWGYDESDPRCVEFKEKLAAVIGAVYDSGIKHFICGMALGCDMYCAEAVIRLKKMHSDVTLQAAVPYRGQADSWNEYNRLRYDRIVDNCDEVTVPVSYTHLALSAIFAFFGLMGASPPASKKAENISKSAADRCLAVLSLSLIHI